MTGFYTTSPLGPQQALTPEGFLIIRGVPLARTGVQLYSEKEIPIKGDASGRILIDRDPDEVFRPQTIASLQGKPITVDHPDDDVGPENYHDLAVGHVINPRQGTGVFDHLLLGDLLIHNQKAIDAIRNKQVREVSVGYKADYVETGDARGKQKNILCNHLALVKDGRCGPVCRIGDKAYYEHELEVRDPDPHNPLCTCDTCSWSYADDDEPSVHDAFEEGKHPRGEGGKFASGSGSGGQHEVKYFGREGRRTKQGYKILHILKVNGQKFELPGRTKEDAIRSAISQLKGDSDHTGVKDWSYVNVAGERYKRLRARGGKTGRHIHIHL